MLVDQKMIQMIVEDGLNSNLMEVKNDCFLHDE